MSYRATSTVGVLLMLCGTAVAAPSIPPGAAPPPVTRPAQPGAAKPEGIRTGCAGGRYPHVAAVNGAASGVLLEPGTKVAIVGCMMGTKGTAHIAGFSHGKAVTIPLVIEAWGDELVSAHLDPALTGVRDIGSVSLNITPDGASEMGLQTAGRFRAVREETLIRPSLYYTNYHLAKNLSQIWGPPKIEPATQNRTGYFGGDGFVRLTRWIPATRDIGQKYCPAFDASAPPFDVWPLADVVDADFEVVKVIADSETSHTSGDATNAFGETIQNVVVGGFGAKADAQRIVVNLEGHSAYGGGSSTCSSIYTLAVLVRGPRGVYGGVKWTIGKNNSGPVREP